MIYRIFDHTLAGHTWSASGRLCIVAQPLQGASREVPSAEAEVYGLLRRLILRSRSDRVLHRAAKRLAANPSTDLNDLARELGVTPRYLVSGLRAILGVDPAEFARKLVERAAQPERRG
jgi:hypothetical protein